MQEVFNKYIFYLEVERNASPCTVRNYTNDLLGNYKRGSEKGFFQFLRLKEIDELGKVDKHTIRDYTSWLMGQNVTKTSIARKLSAIRSFYRYLAREEILPDNQLVEVSAPKLDRRLPSFLTIEEMVQLLKAPDLANPQGLRDRAIIELIYASGLRVSELVKLNLGQINLDSNEIRVWGKGSKERVVLIGEPATMAITNYINRSRPKLVGKRSGDALFLNRYGSRLTERTVQMIFEKYAALAGLDKKVYPHLLRHTFATHMLDGGADLRVVQELLGHASLASTQIYTHVTKSQARKVYLAAHPMAGKDEEREKG
ncbi:MAG: tyrosine recombinase XerC [Dehalococcoidales bacterium]|jgi:integrase/recombinase XerC|nr:tyrosine recombinase XerC [Dehalococcoidales bacterium]